ncbi:MAG: hypothetical protein PVG22_18245 [Chromatiales bacterium]|jgi:hypothetical protein
MFDLFAKRRPLLEAASSQWLFEGFDWSLKHFDAPLFFRDTLLVLPDNRHFPGRADTAEGMANLIFDQVKRYAGVSHWPTRLAPPNSCSLVESPQVEIKGALRGPDGVVDPEAKGYLLIPYNPQQLSNPEGLIASFAHVLAHHLGQMATEPPPGGIEFWPHITELLAIYLGFGLMFANSAFTFRGGCGSCYNPQANRDAYLSELESTYALAIFAVLKAIPHATVTGHLKRHLRSSYKQAVKEIGRRSNDLAKLRSNAETESAPRTNALQSAVETAP